MKNSTTVALGELLVGRRGIQFFWLFMIFVCGGNVANNLSGLIHVNPHYECAWWKIFLSVVASVLFAIRATTRQ